MGTVPCGLDVLAQVYEVPFYLRKQKMVQTGLDLYPAVGQCSPCRHHGTPQERGQAPAYGAYNSTPVDMGPGQMGVTQSPLCQPDRNQA
jgi:hypothetical protein